MPIVEVTNEGLREAVESIEIACKTLDCTRPSAHVVRCRTFHSVASTRCTPCLEQMKANVQDGVERTGGATCAHCFQAGASFEEIFEVLPLSGGAS